MRSGRAWRNWKRNFEKKIVIKADPNLHQEQYEVVMV